MNAKQLRELADSLFSKRTSLVSLWQEQAENFYPERADFTLKRYIGTDFAANLTTSYPIICRRDLGDQFSAMLRPTAQMWHHMRVRNAPSDDEDDNEVKRYLEWANETMHRAMYDPVAKFNRATKEGDQDFAAFGQCVISVELNRNATNLLYRCWHLRDVVWQEDANGEICFVARKWKPGARDLENLFPAKVDQKVKDLATKKPFEEVECMHIVCAEDMYDDKANGKPRWSIYYDCSHNKVIEAIPIYGRIYRIPRWQTVSGSQYAFSPATVAALPEARLIQAMAYTLLEAGEKVVNPPIIATEDAVRSDMAIYAGGVTWIDRDYDERLGEAMRPMTIDAKGMPLSRELQNDTRAIINQCFYLNKLTMPPSGGGEMTAYEVGQRIQEYIRGALPLFEPMEAEYNGGICEETFELLQRSGAFGSPFSIPQKIRGADIQFMFESPLHEAIDQKKVATWGVMKQLLADAVAFDQSSVARIDFSTALKDALSGASVPAKWVNSDVKVADIQAAQQAAAKAQQTLAAMGQASEVAANLGMAHKGFASGTAISGGGDSSGVASQLTP